MLFSLLILVFALMLDALLGEPRRWHPLVGFGRLAAALEQALYGSRPTTPVQMRAKGVAALVIAIAPLSILACLITWLPGGWLFELIGLYLCLGRHSLRQHLLAVATPLAEGDLERARSHLGRIVSRDTDSLDQTGIAAAAVESALENGHDALFATLFWFLLAGLPGALLHRLANTLDAMWGYRNERYREFGWAAARLDDLLGWIPARVTALGYAACGATAVALHAWRTQAEAHDSPNAGPVMAAGAGALEVRVGGDNLYQGRLRRRPRFGFGATVSHIDIQRALNLIDRTLLLWLLVVLALALAVGSSS
ncbi:adenosylcobinamide-phosphate synthase CbiB [Motiliproteus sediminis]|uniref:adenosylcobinamide-phosphate synthase CbiB n=1 Tax=Motiliproteus sediminis TaxID=1468178 RepID=UPI001AEFDFCC|nr:adenosylcobinamide-phosphate synthase CbiB [Motiliproteus sediminis]